MGNTRLEVTGGAGAHTVLTYTEHVINKAGTSGRHVSQTATAGSDSRTRIPVHMDLGTPFAPCQVKSTSI